MGDYFQTFVDLDAGPEDAQQYADRAVRWLVAKGIVLAERTDCVIGPPLGHPPGPKWAEAVDCHSSQEAPYDGLAVCVGREIFDSGQGDPEAVTCPRCAASTSLVDDDWELDLGLWRPFRQAMDTWESTGTGEAPCPACAHPVPITEFTYEGCEFAYGCLGLTFWNWPEFTGEFEEDLSEALDGHRVECIEGKL
ncbi:hypothetical protein [Streptomyces sp. NPDC058045]|uniref:hypothetical protein n=1 Tax=Streptomyces sp. NPDC058045 TaxID=3346311 RepID=UPI0036EFB8B9